MCIDVLVKCYITLCNEYTFLKEFRLTRLNTKLRVVVGGMVVGTMGVGVGVGVRVVVSGVVDRVVGGVVGVVS